MAAFFCGLFFVGFGLLGYYSLTLARWNVANWLTWQYQNVENAEPRSWTVAWTRGVAACVMVVFLALALVDLNTDNPTRHSVWSYVKPEPTAFSVQVTDETVLDSPFADPTVYAVMGDSQLDPGVDVRGARRGDLIVGIFIPNHCAPGPLLVNETDSTVKVALELSDRFVNQEGTCAFSALGSLVPGSDTVHILDRPGFDISPPITLVVVNLSRPLGDRQIETFDAGPSLYYTGADVTVNIPGRRPVRDPAGSDVPPVPLQTSQIP